MQYAQVIFPSDPYYLIEFERHNFLKQNRFQSSSFRPIIQLSNYPNIKITYRNDIFLNNNSPNLENMGNKYVGKGLGLFTGVKFNYLN